MAILAISFVIACIYEMLLGIVRSGYVRARNSPTWLIVWHFYCAHRARRSALAGGGMFRGKADDLASRADVYSMARRMPASKWRPAIQNEKPAAMEHRATMSREYLIAAAP
jgi:hypothetical protein